jgi:hypothetical protein
MGCRLSQPLPSSESAPSQLRNSNNPNNNSSNSNSSPTKNAPSAAAATTTTTTTTASQDDAVYRRLLQAQSPALSAAQRKHLLTPLLQLKGFRRSHARFVDAKTKQTPLHLLCQLLSVAFEEELPIQKLLQAMVATHPPALAVEDRDGNVPLHYALVDRRDEESKRESNSTKNNTKNNNSKRSSFSSFASGSSPPSLALVSLRLAAVQVLLSADPHTASHYLQAQQPFQGVSPLYRVLQWLPDDFTAHHDDLASSSSSSSSSPTVDYVALLRNAFYLHSSSKKSLGTMVNRSNGDQPLALLYRRFTRQFDMAEQFFSGDNSRPEVVLHRKQYKIAAGHTWRMMELLLSPVVDKTQQTTTTTTQTQPWRLVHRAVQVPTPPDLLRYIVETHARDLTVPDDQVTGNLPLHYAASSTYYEEDDDDDQNNSPYNSSSSPYNNSNSSSPSIVPAVYTKYVVDELLYKFPQAATIKNAAGHYPLTCAILASKKCKHKKHWIGGGMQSLYEAYPQAIQQLHEQDRRALQKALNIGDSNHNHNSRTSPAAFDNDDDCAQEEKKLDSTPLASSSPHSTLTNTTTMTTPPPVIPDEPHDAIMLVQQDNVHVMQIVTNMWAHEEDAGVQMLSCVAISRLLQAAIKGKKAEEEEEEGVLRIALLSVAGVVNAMKAHPNEVIVQEKACHALRLMACTDGLCEVSFVASGAVAAIVGAMQAHVSDVSVQEEACAAIAEIIRHGGAHRATMVASVSGLTAILNAISAHATSREVQQSGCLALQALTDYSSANLPTLPRSQTEPLLLAAKQKFPKECASVVNVLLTRLET